MDENLPMIRISVRNLVEFILREGNHNNLQYPQEY